MIVLDGVTKHYRSLFGQPIVALSRVSLEFAAGTVVGIAGPNGAGKSTLINLLLGFLAPTAGRLTIEGMAPRRWIERHGIGYVPEVPAIPQRWMLRGALARYATLAAVPAPDRAARREAALGRLGLTEQAPRRIRQLSKGMRQRAAIAQALVRQERLYVFDEPANGLDPLWTIAFRELLGELRAPGVLVLVASHDLDELERVADRVIILHEGRVSQDVPLRGAAMPSPWFRLVMHGGADLVRELFPAARMIDGDTFEFPAPSIEELNSTLAELIARGGRIGALIPRRQSLEEAFRDAVRSPDETS